MNQDPNTVETPNYLDLPDDQVANMSAPPEAPVVAEAAPPAGEQAGASGEQPNDAGEGAAAEAGEQAGAAGDGAGQAGEGGEAAAGGEGGESGKPAGEVDPNNPEGGTAAPAGQEAAAGGEGGEAGKDTGKEKPAGEAGAPAKEATQIQAPKSLATYTADDKAAAFDKIMAPFKANGREIKLESPEEVTKLLQMGANYTKKMQALQPVMRVVKMLENNQLMDESKLSFLIDLSKGDSAAINKLLADSQFDPMAADKDKAASYKPGDHQVTDNEVRFQQVLDEVVDTTHGAELITEVQRQWDSESKQALFQNPDVLVTLNQQKELGLYQLITDEVSRLRALGQIGPQVPFLQAYRAVGDMLHEQGRLKPKDAAPPAQEQPVEVRVAAPAAPAANGDKAKAAAATKSAAPGAAKTEVDVLGLSDADFLKQMGGRV